MKLSEYARRNSITYRTAFIHWKKGFKELAAPATSKHLNRVNPNQVFGAALITGHRNAGTVAAVMIILKGINEIFHPLVNLPVKRALIILVFMKAHRISPEPCLLKVKVVTLLQVKIGNVDLMGKLFNLYLVP